MKEKTGKKESVQIELCAQQKSREGNLNIKYYQDLLPLFNLFAKMLLLSTSICECLDLYLCFIGYIKNKNSNPRIFSHF